MLLEPIKIGNKTAVNRLFSQAMEANDGENGGKVSERVLERYKKLAAGNWGVVVVEALSVSDTSLARINGMILNRKNLDGFKRLVDEFKKINDKSLILFQVNHSGRNSHSDFSEKVSVSPCDASDPYRYLSTDEVEGIKNKFVEATLLADEVGADGVDFKMCHGYLGGEILRPNNTRDDKWGGSFENRVRFLTEGIPEIRNNLKNKDFVIGSRVSLYEGIRGGCGTSSPTELVEDLSQMLEVAKVMDGLNMDYINVSAGIPAITATITRPTPPAKFMYLQHFRYTKTVKEYLQSLNSNMRVIGSAYSILMEEGIDIADDNIKKKKVPTATLR